MYSEKKHPIRVLAAVLLTLVLVYLSWIAATTGDIFPGILPWGALPVDQEVLGAQLPQGALAVFDRNGMPKPGDALAYAEGGEKLGWLYQDGNELVVGSDPVWRITITEEQVLGRVLWRVDHLGSAVLFLRANPWLAFGALCGCLAVWIWSLATRKKRRHKRKVQRMLDTFQRTASRYENDCEDF